MIGRNHEVLQSRVSAGVRPSVRRYRPCFDGGGCLGGKQAANLGGLPSPSFAGSLMEHGFLNLIGKAAQMDSQSIEQFPFRFVRSEVSDESALC
jgi:hypothetical protein